MRLRMFATAVLVVALAIAAAAATGTSQASVDRGAGGCAHGLAHGRRPGQLAGGGGRRDPDVQGQHPGVDVNVQYQSWGDYKTKFEATLSAGSGPDVLEFGNTDVPKYSAAGALAPLNKADFPNSGTWLSGLDEGRQLQRQAVRGARTTPARAASSTAPTSTRRRGSRRPRRRSPSSTPPTRS